MQCGNYVKFDFITSFSVLLNWLQFMFGKCSKCRQLHVIKISVINLITELLKFCQIERILAIENLKVLNLLLSSSFVMILLAF